MEAAKAVLIKTSIALNTYLRKEESFKMNNLNLQGSHSEMVAFIKK